MPKLPELKAWSSLYRPLVLGLTETWLRPAVNSSELSLQGYALFRCDRVGSSYGGVVLYVADELKPSLVASVADPDGQFEMIWARSHPSLGPPVLFGVLYRSPSCTSSSWVDSLRDFSQQNRLCVMGDFNCPHVCWDSLTATQGASEADLHLLDFSIEFGLSQLIRMPTRYTPSGHSCLDLLFYTPNLEINNARCTDPISTSDHSLVLADFRPPANQLQPPRQVRNFWKIDIPLLHSLAAAIPWSQLVTDDIDASWSHFKSMIEFLTSQCVPLATPSTALRRPPWLTRDIRRLLAARRRAWKSFTSSGSHQSYAVYRSLRNRCKSLISRSRADYEKNLLLNAATQPRRLFAYLNRRRKLPGGIPTLNSLDGAAIQDDTGKANLLADQYSSIYPDLPTQCGTLVTDYPDAPSLSDIFFTPDDVASLLARLDPSKSAGPDDMHPAVLKRIAHHIAPAVYSLFRTSLDQGALPSDWKQGTIRPIFKSGDPALPANYRPICLTSVLVKTLEKIIRSHLDRHLIANGLLPSNQHGFVPGKSCVTNLLLAREAWARAWDHHTPVHALSIDFSKAFDRVNHATLLLKLNHLHISGKVVNWIAAYLHHRTWRVRVGCDFSRPVVASTGVPQGAVLGPRLFTIYVHDVAHQLQSSSLLFADDLKIWRCISSPYDQLVLQQDLDRLSGWALRNDLPVNPQKSSLLAIGAVAPAPSLHYWLAGSPVTPSHSVKDLGVIVSSDLSTTAHTEKARKSALRVLWLLKRSLASWSATLFRTAYTTLIRPVMEYGAPAFFPLSKGETLRLEYVQRLGTRLIPSFRQLEFPDRYKRLNLFSLEYRRVRADLILLFRVIVRQDYPDLQHLVPRSPTPHTRGHQYKLEVQRSDNVAHDVRWSRRHISTWNCLPPSVVSAPSVAAFKSSLDAHLSQFAFGGTSLRGRSLVVQHWMSDFTL